MQKQSEFKVPVPNSDSANFSPSMKLPDHLDQYAKISADLRHTMTPIMKAILELTDKSCLRSAALPILTNRQ